MKEKKRKRKVNEKKEEEIVVVVMLSRKDMLCIHDMLYPILHIHEKQGFICSQDPLQPFLKVLMI